jgi:opacity protein-like surface antigen
MALRFPAGPVRPYVVAGIGLIKRSIDYVQGAPQASTSDSRAAYSLGAGVNVFFSQHVGINGDFRYFRNFTAGNIVMDLSNDHFDYSRASLGVVFKF